MKRDVSANRRAYRRAAARRRLIAGALLLLAAVLVITGIALLQTHATPIPTDHTVAASRPTSPLRLGAAPHLPSPAGTANRTQDAALTRFAHLGRPVFCGGTERRMVALTFDDGPGVYTHYAITKLKAAHLHATFFLVGKEIRAWPGLTQREESVAAFGDHTMTHPFLPELSPAAIVSEIAGAQRLIERTVQRPVQMFRPPYEAHTSAIDAEVRRLGMVEILWDVDSADSLGGNYLDIERRVIAGLAPGSIVLMHENHGQTIRALNVIFAALHRRRLHAVTVPELLAEDPPAPAQLRAGFAGCPVHLISGGGS